MFPGHIYQESWHQTHFPSYVEPFSSKTHLSETGGPRGNANTSADTMWLMAMLLSSVLAAHTIYTPLMCNEKRGSEENWYSPRCTWNSQMSRRSVTESPMDNGGLESEHLIFQYVA